MPQKYPPRSTNTPNDYFNDSFDDTVGLMDSSPRFDVPNASKI